MSQTYRLSDVEEPSVILKSPPPCLPLAHFFTPITQDMFAWHALWLIHSDSFLFLPHVERNRNGVPCWKTLFTNVASACPAWSTGLFLLHYMAGNRSWLGLAHVLPPPWRQPGSIILTTALYSHSAASLSEASSLTLASMQTLMGHTLTVQTFRK